MRLIAADAAAIIPSMAEIVLFHHALGLTSGVLAFAGPFAGRVEGLPAELVDAGFSLGLVPAQKLAQTRPGALGADIDAARAIVEEADDGELFLYPGDAHYFADSSLPSYDAQASALLMKRVLDFLAGEH